MVNCITINTDASFGPFDKVGGYGYYIICDKFKIRRGGMFKNHPKNSIEAEMMCIANAIHTLINIPSLPTTKYIIINCDCLMAFENIGLKKGNEIGRRIAKQLKELKNKTSFRNVHPKVEFRHVKSHSGKNDARSYINEWCDREAKRWMKQAAMLKRNSPRIKDLKEGSGVNHPEHGYLQYRGMNESGKYIFWLPVDKDGNTQPDVILTDGTQFVDLIETGHE